jgi:cytochrome c peroxidase
LVLAASAMLGACEEDKPPPPRPAPTAPSAKTTAVPSATAVTSATPTGQGPLTPCLFLPEMKVPADNPLTQEKIDLGKILFFDKRLGKDSQHACEGCHFEDKGWADGLPFSTKADGKVNTRHTPNLHNVGYYELWYWDGRAATLEAQILAAWKGQLGGDPDKAAGELAKVEEYKTRFKAAFGKDEVTADNVVKALASFIRSLRSCNAPFDTFEQDREKNKAAVSESAARGAEIFSKKANCALCHAPPLYSDAKFHNVGVGYDKPEPDGGRFAATKAEEDKGKFKTPSLRSVTTHAPYFHNGSAKTLEEAVDYMLSGGHANPNLDKQLKKIELTPEEKKDLVEFLKSLEGQRQPFEKPKVP